MYVLQISLLFQGLFRVPENTFLNSGFQNLQLRGLADHYEMVKLVTEKKKNQIVDILNHCLSSEEKVVDHQEEEELKLVNDLLSKAQKTRVKIISKVCSVFS